MNTTTNTIHTGSAAGTRRPRWLGYALATTLLWGVWGAFTGVPSQHGFPETLVYVVWALTMVPPALIVLARAGWKVRHDGRAIAYGLAIGLLGAGGQMILFYAVKAGPTYLIFPLISLSPVLTIALSFVFLRERTGMMGLAGIVLAICALPLFDYTPGGAPQQYGLWFVLALGVLVAWGWPALCWRCARCRCSTTRRAVRQTACSSTACGSCWRWVCWWRGVCRLTSSSWPTPAWTPRAFSFT
jgi:uncharacterized membrane protein